MDIMEKYEKDVTADDTKPNYRGWKSMPYVIGNETFEKLGTTGSASNLLVYLTSIFHMKSITATTIINIFNGTTNIATLLGAFLCDTYFGRYKTLGFASIVSFLGLLVLTLTAAVSTLHPPQCGGTEEAETCLGPTPWQMTFLISGLGLLVIGAGGIRPCNLAFGADQFNPDTESGKRGVTSFFNWYYFTFTFAMMVSLTIVVYVQSDVSWAWGLAIPTFMMLCSCVLFFMGTKLYVKIKPDGSPLASTVQVVAAAINKRRLKLPEQPWLSLYNHVPKSCINSKLPHTDQFRFFDKAAIMTPEDKLNPDGSTTDPWRLSSMQKVEELKCLIRVIPIWVSAVVYYVAIVQQQTFVVFQALQSDRWLGNSNFKIPGEVITGLYVDDSYDCYPNNRLREKERAGILCKTMEKHKKEIETEESKVNYRGWKSMPFVIGNETFEKLGTTGTSTNLLVYLTSVFHMRSITAATLINIFNGYAITYINSSGAQITPTTL